MNRRKLLEEMARRPPGSSRAARFRCVLALARGGESARDFEGTVEGRIIGVGRGEGGFGYDPLFQPNGYEKTFAELLSAEKNAISHRATAVSAIEELSQNGANWQSEYGPGADAQARRRYGAGGGAGGGGGAAGAPGAAARRRQCPP